MCNLAGLAAFEGKQDDAPFESESWMPRALPETASHFPSGVQDICVAAGKSLTFCSAPPNGETIKTPIGPAGGPTNWALE